MTALPKGLRKTDTREQVLLINMTTYSTKLTQQGVNF